MLHERIPNLANFVEPDRVRREVYTDAAIFEMEMERIHERVWIYCGHETQVPKAGDYYTTRIGRQPMLMVRDKGGKVNVLYNRCPHFSGARKSPSTTSATARPKARSRSCRTASA